MLVLTLNLSILTKYEIQETSYKARDGLNIPTIALPHTIPLVLIGYRNILRAEVT
jgi:hypothetical protein